MFDRSVRAGMACAAVVAAAWVHAEPAVPTQAAARPGASSVQPSTPHAKPRLDRTGRSRIGKASFYGGKFSGRKMADGTRMDPQADSAASKTLPLGTTAKVTNLATGDSAVVTIRDRGPHVPGRIVDLTPETARKVGIDRQEGVSKVEVTPLRLPPSDERGNTPDAAPQARAAGSHRASASMPR